MRYPGIILVLAILFCILAAGCTTNQGAGSIAARVTEAPAAPATAAPEPSVTEGAAVAVTTTPAQVVTIVHQVSLVKDVKDSELLFALQVPVEWSPSTVRLENPENFIGFMYRTDLVKNNTFTIHTFTNYRSRDQNFRDECRTWKPAPAMSTVVINGITFDRFESSSNGKTNVTYVSRSSNMNEAGYVSVLAFSADNANRFEKEDFEKVIRSFRYLAKDEAGSTVAEEIYRVPPEEYESGNAKSSSGTHASASSSSSGGSSCPNRR